MNKRFRFLLVKALLLFFHVSWGKEVLKFDIILFGDKIGQMTFTREERSDGTIYYDLHSDSKAKILWINKDNKSHYEFTYKGDKLISTQYKEWEGGKVSRWGSTQWDGEKYVVKNYKGNRTFTENPDHTIVSLYFGNVSKITRVFYDSEAEFTPVVWKDNNTLEFKTSDNHKNTYYYESGKLKQLEVQVPFATVKIVSVL